MNRVSLVALFWLLFFPVTLAAPFWFMCDTTPFTEGFTVLSCHSGGTLAGMSGLSWFFIGIPVTVIILNWGA